jgi:hypothetical protein
MNRSSLPLVLAVAVAIAMVFVPGCDDDDDNTSLPPDQVVEAGLNSALQTTVVPLFEFMGAIGDLLGAAPATAGPRGAVCPDTSGWCITGTVACTFTGTAYHFDFDECQAVTGDDPLLLDGDIDAVPGSTVALTLTNLFINNSPAMSGNGTINTISCDYFVDVTTADASIVGTITSCDSDPYPTGDTLIISFDDYVMTITLDGSNTASVVATSGATPVAFCTIDLDSDPLTSVCDPY